MKSGKKISNTMQKRFASKPVYNGEYLKTKIKSHGNKINTDFYGNKVPTL